MQSHQDYHQRRPPYDPQSRMPSGLSPSHLSSQTEPHKAPQSQAPSAASQLAKLDGVLYHFYTTTANLVLQSRLARFRSQFLAGSADAIEQPQQLIPTDLPIAGKSSKWFALQIPENDLFKEELRFWRSITTILDTVADTSGTASVVPDMVIDVILDLSQVPDHHQTLIVPHSHAASDASLFATTPSSPSRLALDRVPIDSGATREEFGNKKGPKLVVIEQWRLNFQPLTPSAPPELPTLYKRSIVHFRALFSLLLALPSNRLSARLESFYKQGAQGVSSPTKPSSYPTLSARNDLGSHDHEMQIGCRLSMGNGVEDAERGEGEFLIQDPLPPETDSGRPVGELSHLAERTLTPIVTPIGNITMSVKFRKLADYSVEDSESLSRARSMAVEVDEDYFKPATCPAPVTSTLNVREPASNSLGNGGRFPFPSHVQQQIGGITAGRISHGIVAGASTTPPVVPEPATEAALSQSPAQNTVFSTGASARPVAGLSSLRGTGLPKVGSIGSSLPPTTPHSPALAAALNTEPAFVAPGAIRRTSTSDRRLRSSGSGMSGLGSPPISPSAGNFDLPETSTSLPKNIHSAHTATASSLKPKIGRLGSGGSLLSGAVPSRAAGSFSPSSSSPLAPHMSLHGSRVASANAAASGSNSISHSRLSSSPGVRSLATDSGLSAPSLRSVFQSYAKSPVSVSSSFSRTSPNTSTAAPVPPHGSYSPSNLGSSQRSTSIRRYSNTSDAGSGSALGTSTSVAAQPQMIKRYSTNFSYRQNRDRQSTFGSSLGSEGSGSVPGAEPSSYPYARGQGGSLSSAYGRSWITRMEQRQGLGGPSSGAFTHTSSQDENSGTTAASSTRFRNSPAAVYTPTGVLTPSPRSQDEEIGAFMRLLNSKPAFGSSSMGRHGGSRGERRSASALGSTPEESGRGIDAGGSGDNLGTDFKGAAETRRISPASSQPLIGNPRAVSSNLRSSVYSPIRTAHPLSRSQVDEMLSRMAESVGMISVSDGAAPGMSRSLSCADPEPRSYANLERTSSSKGKARPGLKGVFDNPTSHDLHSEQTTELPKSNTPGTTATAGSHSPSTFASPGRSPFAGGQARGMQTAASVQDRDDTSDANVSRFNAPGLDLVSAARRLNEQSATMAPDYEMEGDLMFGADQPHYDIEDDLPGKMDMATEEEAIHDFARTSRRSSQSAEVAGGTKTSRRGGYGELGVQGHAAAPEGQHSGFGDGIEGGRGATLPAGAHRNGGLLQSGPMTDWQRSEQRERERALEAERRRADAEMSRNFGQEVGASTRGRGSLSPWRASGHVASQSGGGPSSLSTPSPSSVTPPTTSLHTGVGFRSSSTRPLNGGGRLGQTPALAGGESQARRGYGVSAPSTQFHYHPHQLQSRQSSNSYPVSRDEMHDPAAEDDDEDDDDSKA